ncbi:hypothetical protein [Gimesia chilikensis]|uniref:Core-binding (CB) domain-containing protein n=1 Tax=Gimesia chilikensis TaxID=2605989 RepID=A0A517PKK6_9PLAN|nr:hypothetical protein [Gimesia chilikensis]QDT19909.1 hypothetical protein HG66A1_16770 [Gimesia chilikensis]
MAVTRKKDLKPDSQGRYRPRIGYIDSKREAQKRFNLGTSKIEAEAKRAKIQAIYDHQCKKYGHDFWDDIVLQFADAVAKDQPVHWTVFSNDSTSNDYEAAMEASILNEISETYNVPIKFDNEEQIQYGQKVLREMIAEDVQEAISNVNARYNQEFGPLAAKVRLSGNPLTTDFSKLEKAIQDYVTNIETTGKRIENGSLSLGSQNRIRLIKQVNKQFGHLTLAELSLQQIDEIVGIWRNRPPSIYSSRCSFDHAEGTIKQIFRFLDWLDTSDYRWEKPKGVDKINRKVVVFPSEKQNSAITIDTYAPTQLVEIIKECNDFQKAIILLCLNCSFSHAEVGRVTIDRFLLDTPHPYAETLGIESNSQDSWLLFNRPKTGVYGEWYLWPETVRYLKLAIDRAKKLGSEFICINGHGNPMYNEAWKAPQSAINTWWNGKPTKSTRKVGIVTKVGNRIEDFPRYPFKSLRKTVSNELRKRFGGEVASLMLCHGNPTNDDLLNIYADRPFGLLHDALRKIHSFYEPVFKELKT